MSRYVDDTIKIVHFKNSLLHVDYILRQVLFAGQATIGMGTGHGAVNWVRTAPTSRTLAQRLR